MPISCGGLRGNADIVDGSNAGTPMLANLLPPVAITFGLLAPKNGRIGRIFARAFRMIWGWKNVVASLSPAGLRVCNYYFFRQLMVSALESSRNES